MLCGACLRLSLRAGGEGKGFALSWVFPNPATTLNEGCVLWGAHAPPLAGDIVMRATLSVCLLVFCAAGLAAKEPTLQEARLRWLKGNYAEALDLFKELAGNDKSRVEATLGISRCHQSEGEYEKSLEVIDTLLK